MARELGVIAELQVAETLIEKEILHWASMTPPKKVSMRTQYISLLKNSVLLQLYTNYMAAELQIIIAISRIQPYQIRLLTDVLLTMLQLNY